MKACDDRAMTHCKLLRRVDWLAGVAYRAKNIAVYGRYMIACCVSVLQIFSSFYLGAIQCELTFE